jgi:hypothetical protein
MKLKTSMEVKDYVQNEEEIEETIEDESKIDFDIRVKTVGKWRRWQ